MTIMITAKKNRRMNAFPFNMASLAPNKPPNALQAAMGNATAYKIFPLIAKNTNDPKLEARFTILVCALALRKSNPNSVINANIIKLPAPGPIKPS